MQCFIFIGPLPVPSTVSDTRGNLLIVALFLFRLCNHLLIFLGYFIPSSRKIGFRMRFQEANLNYLFKKKETLPVACLSYLAYWESLNWLEDVSSCEL